LQNKAGKKTNIKAVTMFYFCWKWRRRHKKHWKSVLRIYFVVIQTGVFEKNAQICCRRSKLVWDHE